MRTTSNNLSTLTADVLAKSAEFATRIQGHMPSVQIDVGHYSNDAFMLRSYVSIRADNDGDELAMTVDIRTLPAIDAGTTISIESDICMDDGTIVAAGPSAVFGDSALNSEVHISAWCKEFDAFLRKSEHRVVNALEEIISKKSKLEN
jgi:hypothetical protein